MILNGARCGFDIFSRSVVVFTRFKSAPPRVQLMPTTHNITAHLARIHKLKILASLIEKDDLNQK